MCKKKNVIFARIRIHLTKEERRRTKKCHPRGFLLQYIHDDSACFLQAVLNGLSPISKALKLQIRFQLVLVRSVLRSGLPADELLTGVPPSTANPSRLTHSGSKSIGGICYN